MSFQLFFRGGLDRLNKQKLNKPDNMQNIYDFITTEENSYKTTPVNIAENYEWNMFEHISKTVNYINSKFTQGANDGNRPYKNIIKPIINLAHRAEGFDVKDIQLFVNSKSDYYKSFLVKKFHEKWARDNKIDTFIDNMVESYVDFGGVLVKNVNEKSPERVPLQRIAFCDQTDIMSGPIAEKHFFAPNELKEMESKGWENIEDALVMAENEKSEVLIESKKTETPGKYIEVYELHGVFPSWWLDDTPEVENNISKEENDKDFSRQIHIVVFVRSEDEKTKTGITLFKGKEKESPYKFLSRDKIYGRTLGMGGAEELFEPQVWTNYDQIHVKGMLDEASKIIYKTSDPALAKRNNTKNMGSGAIVEVAQGSDLVQVNTFPVNITAFESATKNWEAHARQMGAATEAIAGESPSSGTPFKLQELITAESHSLHEYRKGQIAIFLDEIYQDWILPYISREITSGQEFLAELELDELQFVADSLVTNETNKMIVERILNGETIFQDEIEIFKLNVREQFMKGGNDKFIKIFKDEMKDAPIDVFVNIVGKQKNLDKNTDKLVNVFRQILAAPQVLDDPRMAKIFNEILESSGLSPVDFFQRPQEQPPVQGTPVLEETSKTPKGGEVAIPKITV